MARRPKIIRFPKSPPPPPVEPPARPAEGRLVEACRCRGQAEALVVRGFLDSMGIPTALRSHLAQSVHPFSVGDQAVTVILVPSEVVDRAKRLLARRRLRVLRTPSP